MSLNRQPIIGPGSLVQGTVPADARLGSLLRVRRLEAVLLDPSGALVHYHRDQTRPDRAWVRGETVTHEALGPGAIAQEPGGPLRPGALHVVVAESWQGAIVRAHYAREAGVGASRRWRRLGTFDEAAWPGLFTCPPVSLFTGPARDAVAVAMAATGLSSLPLIGDALAALPGGDRGVARLATASGGSGWLQALVQEGPSVYQWHRQRWRGRVRWVRAACLRLDPGDGHRVDRHSSVKLAQVTGERDTQPSTQDATLSFSESVSGVRGTDLGVRVDLADRAVLLFGDSHWTRPGRVTRDAIGLVTEAGPVPGLPGVELHGAPLRILGGPATSREYDVPLDGFELDGALHVFFSSHHFQRHQVMGRSLLTRLARPLAISGAERRRSVDFRLCGTFSDRFFVNVSTVRRGDRLLVWGSGSYRADDLRLAEFDLTEPRLRAALAGAIPWTRPQGGVRYFVGRRPDGSPSWSPHEDAAAPVLPGAFGEISVRWVPEVGRFVLLAMDGPEDPVGTGVTLRAAWKPWGPWTPRLRLFDWDADGKSRHDEASRFIRAHHEGDPVGDAIFKQQQAMTGAAYAPYLFDSRADGDAVVLRYTLSTWNPYQVVLMQHRLGPESVAWLRGAGPA